MAINIVFTETSLHKSHSFYFINVPISELFGVDTGYFYVHKMYRVHVNGWTNQIPS